MLKDFFKSNSRFLKTVFKKQIWVWVQLKRNFAS